MLLGFGILTLGCLGYFLTEVLHAPMISEGDGLCLGAGAALDQMSLRDPAQLR